MKLAPIKFAKKNINLIMKVVSISMPIRYFVKAYQLKNQLNAKAQTISPNGSASINLSELPQQPEDVANFLTNGDPELISLYQEQYANLQRENYVSDSLLNEYNFDTKEQFWSYVDSLAQSAQNGDDVAYSALNKIMNEYSYDIVSSASSSVSKIVAEMMANIPESIQNISFSFWDACTMLPFYSNGYMTYLVPAVIGSFVFVICLTNKKQKDKKEPKDENKHLKLKSKEYVKQL